MQSELPKLNKDFKKDKDKNESKKSTKITVGVAVLLLLLTLSYGYLEGIDLLPYRKQTASAKAAELKLTYTDCAMGREEDCAAINASLEPGDSVEKTFEVDNDGSKDIEHNIYLLDLMSTFKNEELVYKLENLNTGEVLISETPVPYRTEPQNELILEGVTAKARTKTRYKLTITYLNKDYNQIENMDAEFSMKVSIELKKQFTITFDANGGETSITSRSVNYGEPYGELPEPTRDGYDFVGWFTEQENGVQVTTSSKVTIVSDQTLYARWKIRKVTQVLAKLGVTPNIQEAGVPDFTSAATTDEGVFALEDDYGTSYYYRGAVENNYIKYGKYGKDVYFGDYNGSSADPNYKTYYKTFNSLEECQNSSEYNTNCRVGITKGTSMWWRIIRINGDGSLRIIYDGTQGYANGTNNIDRYAITDQPWNAQFDDAKYVGWMFGGAQGEESTSKEQAQRNETSCDAKVALDNWYKDNIVETEYARNVVDRVFCNDRSIDSGSGYGTNETSYGAYTRKLVISYLLLAPGETTPTPTPKFTCENKNDAFTVEETDTTNGDLTYPVGLITADEIIAAGKERSISSNYLYKSSHIFGSWSLTPSGFSGSSGNLFYCGISMADARTNIDAKSTRDSHGAIAPVINLSAEYVSTLIGDGTITSPFRDPNDNL